MVFWLWLEHVFCVQEDINYLASHSKYTLLMLVNNILSRFEAKKLILAAGFDNATIHQTADFSEFHSFGCYSPQSASIIVGSLLGSHWPLKAFFQPKSNLWEVFKTFLKLLEIIDHHGYFFERVAKNCRQKLIEKKGFSISISLSHFSLISSRWSQEGSPLKWPAAGSGVESQVI